MSTQEHDAGSRGSTAGARYTAGTPGAPGAAGPRAPGAARPVVVAAAVLAALAAAVLGLIVGSRLGGDGDVPPPEASVDVGFARDMQTHHVQAVQMSSLVRDRSDDPAVRSVALDIMLTQQQQAGQMFGWLEQWGYPQSDPGPQMAWMADHSSHTAVPAGGLMPGMATRAQLNQLAASSGTDAERRFLELMITHHEAGVTMAEYAADNADEDVVRHLALMIVRSQSAELNVLHDLLDARGGPTAG
ncbi:DUF305 domain-containing protein [Georgenia sp. SYP-B2076]|uniref:DUF305 domain-containing protein n=1 Tax=Georgenia sp. SYP-B2076 TaxID=2495881 RepID=UPI001F0C41FF|nr:DUF305 domain-containing protein [Georgenia sp. SYP-B2076]